MFKKLFLVIVLMFVFQVPALADFDWLPKLSIDAKVDLPKFEVELAKRFDLPTVDVKSVVKTVSNVSKEPADAYMVLRLAELSKTSPSVVVETYRKNKDRGWGVIAKELGIKPGSREFHALKRGHDLKLSARSKSSKRKAKKHKDKPGKWKKEGKEGKGGGMGNKH